MRIRESNAPQGKCTRLWLLLVIVFDTLALEYVCHMYLFPDVLQHPVRLEYYFDILDCGARGRSIIFPS